MKRARRQQLLWELIDTMFTKVEYWEDYLSATDSLDDEERKYLFKTISTFAKKVNVTNHINVE